MRVILAGIFYYFHNLVLATSQLINSVLMGDPRETLCSRTGKYLHDTRGEFHLIKIFPILLERVTHLLHKNHVFIYRQWDQGKNSVLGLIKKYKEKRKLRSKHDK